MALAITDIDTLSLPDGIDSRDVTGNGLQDILVNQEGGQTYWYEQTVRGSFTKRTIFGSSISGSKLEGAVWVNVGNEYHAVSLDQNNGNIHLYTPDATADYDGTWSGGIIQGSRNRLQNARAWDIDDDGNEEIVYAWEGTEPSTGGGVHYLKYSGSGDITNSANWTDYTMVTQTGAWWLSRTTKNLGGGLAAKDFVFSARDRGANATQGIYVAISPDSPTGTWSTIRIESANEDWLHVDFGNFFGQTDKDVVAHSYGGDVHLYKFSDQWSRTILLSSYTTATFQGMTTEHTRNGRNKILVSGSNGANNNKASIYSWNGTAWEEELTISNQTAKWDDGLLFMDITGNGINDIVSVDTNSEGNSLSYMTGIPSDQIKQPFKKRLSGVSGVRLSL